MDSFIEQAYSSSNFREQGHKLVDLLADYLEATQSNKKQPVFKRFDPDALYATLNEELSETETNTFANWAKGVVADSIHLHNPGYMGHQVSPVLPEAALADLLSALMNNGVGVYEMGSPTVAMERVVIKQLASQLGFDEDADGILTSGGTLGNLTALLAARQIMVQEDPWKEGTGNTQYAFMVSEQAHYCIDRAVRIMGWGQKGILKVPVDEHYRMDTNKLEEVYSSAQEEGIHIIGVVGSACSTATGSFDPLAKIGHFCTENNLWFHVDAAHGGSAAYSSRYKHRLDGIEQADSVVVDFHKMMMCPALVTGVIFKEAGNSYRSFSQQASYLWNREEPEWFNLGKRTFECTKDMMALKVYTILRQYGQELFGEITERLFALGKAFASIIEEHPDFELLLNPECNIVCFRHTPGDISDLNKYNERLRRALIDRGHFFIVQTELGGNIYLRTTLMNVFTTTEHLQQLLNEIEEVSKSIAP